MAAVPVSSLEVAQQNVNICCSPRRPPTASRGSGYWRPSQESFEPPVIPGSTVLILRSGRLAASRRMSGGLMVRDARRRAPHHEGLLVHRNHPDVVDVGERGTRQQQVAGRGEKCGGVVVGEVGPGIETERLHF